MSAVGVSGKHNEWRGVYSQTTRKRGDQVLGRATRARSRSADFRGSRTPRRAEQSRAAPYQAGRFLQLGRRMWLLALSDSVNEEPLWRVAAFNTLPFRQVKRRSENRLRPIGNFTKSTSASTSTWTNFPLVRPRQLDQR